MASTQQTLPDAHELKRAVSIRAALRHLGWRIRSRTRADCGLCRGHLTGTVAFTERLWHCHRCQAGGDVYKLIQAVTRCEFPQALRYVAELAGVKLEQRGSDFRRDLAERRQKRLRLDRAVAQMESQIRELRLECRRDIHLCDQVLETPGPWSEEQWELARDLAEWRDEFAEPAYELLSFGPMAARVKFVEADWEERFRVAAAVRWEGP